MNNAYKKNIYILSLVVASIILGLFIITKLFVPDMSFWSEAIETEHEVEKVLVDNGICDYKMGCKSQMVFLKPLSNGFQISTFGITNETVINQIDKILDKKMDQTPKLSSIQFYAYRGNGIAISTEHPPQRIGLLFQKRYTK